MIEKVGRNEFSSFSIQNAMKGEDLIEMFNLQLANPFSDAL